MRLEQWDGEVKALAQELYGLEMKFHAARKEEKRALFQKARAIIRYQIAFDRMLEKFTRIGSLDPNVSYRLRAIIKIGSAIANKLITAYRQCSITNGLMLWQAFVTGRLINRLDILDQWIADEELLAMARRQSRMGRLKQDLTLKLKEVQSTKESARKDYARLSKNNPSSLPEGPRAIDDIDLQDIQKQILNHTTGLASNCTKLVAEGSGPTWLARGDKQLTQLEKTLLHIDELQSRMESIRASSPALSRR